MQRIDGFSLYEKQMQNMSGANRKPDVKKDQRPGTPEPVDTFERSAGAGSVMNGVELSDGAKSLLEELKNKYTNMDFFVADYSTEEEAQQYLSRGTKEYSVLIDPETLEKMAANEEIRAKYTEILDNASQKFDEIKEELGEDGKYVDRIGITFTEDGSAKYFAHLTQMSEKQRERIEEGREEAARKAREEDRRAHGPEKDKHPAHPASVKTASVSADSIEELIKAIKDVDWNSIEAKEPKAAGGKFDLTV